MIAGPALAEWLSDSARQGESLEGTAAFAAAWARQPCLAELRRTIAALRPPTAEAVVSAVAGFISDIDRIERLLDLMMSAAAADPFFRPSLPQATSDISSSILLFDEPSLMISIGVTSADALAVKKGGVRGPSSINFSGHLSSFHFVKAGGATLSFWEAPRIGVDFTAARAGRCRLVERRRIGDRETIRIDGRYQSFVIEHAETDLVHLHAMARVDTAPVAVEYDSRSCAFVGATATDEANSRTQLMVSLLRLMDRTDALPLFEESLNSPDFFTRWHVMREYLAMDAEAALPSLRRMAEHDPHAEVRAAARQTLEAFFGNDETQAEEGFACHA